MKDVQVRSTQVFKVKDHPATRRYQFINLEKMFGFVPETIVVEKVDGNNKYRVNAIIPDKILKEMEKEEKKVKSSLASKEKKLV